MPRLPEELEHFLFPLSPCLDDACYEDVLKSKWGTTSELPRLGRRDFRSVLAAFAIHMRAGNHPSGLGDDKFLRDTVESDIDRQVVEIIDTVNELRRFDQVSTSLELAGLVIADDVHQLERRRNGNYPYVAHCMGAAEIVRSGMMSAGVYQREAAVFTAYIHDVFESMLSHTDDRGKGLFIASPRFICSPRIIDELFRQLSPESPYYDEAIEAALLITKKSDAAIGCKIPMDEYRQRIMVSPLARIVKSADTLSNLHDPIEGADPAKSQQQTDEYAANLRLFGSPDDEASQIIRQMEVLAPEITIRSMDQQLRDRRTAFGDHAVTACLAPLAQAS